MCCSVPWRPETRPVLGTGLPFPFVLLTKVCVSHCIHSHSEYSVTITVGKVVLWVPRTLQRTAADKILAFTELAFCDGEETGIDKIDTVGQIVRSAEGTGEQGERGNVTGGQASRGVRVSLTPFGDPKLSQTSRE